MSLRITAILLTIIGPSGLWAADDGSERILTSPEPGVIHVLVPNADPLNGIDLNGIVFQLGAADGLFGGNPDSGLRLTAPDFPFSPRLIRQPNGGQFNYGTRIRDAAQNLGEFNIPPSVLRYRNILTDDASLPLIIPAAATASDACETVQQADAEGCPAACGRCLNPADCPIDVVMAEDETGADGHAPGPLRPITSAPDVPFGQLISGVSHAEPPSLTTTSETCSHAEPPLKIKVEHLLEAARHLAGAGYEEEAKLFRVEAEAIQKASIRLLMEKRQELERLQREVAELEALTGQYQTIRISCRILEIQHAAGGTPCEGLSRLAGPGVHVLAGHSCSPGGKATAGPLSADELTAMLRTLEEESCGTLKTVAAPVLVTMNGRPANLRSGGEFPILIPVGSERAAIEWRNFGVTMQAIPFVLGNGKVRLSLETEVSDRDYSNAVNLQGMVVPGLTTSRFRSDVEARFGETVAIAINSTPNSESHRSLLVLVTAQQVEPQPEPHRHD